MRDNRRDERDSHDTLYVPFVWVPDGAPRPTEWLSRHPDAFWVTARLVRPQPSAGATDADTGKHDHAGTAIVADDQDAGMGYRASVAPIGLGRRRRNPGAYWLTAAGAGQEDPVAAFLRTNEYSSRFTGGQVGSAGHDLAGGAAPTPAPAELSSSDRQGSEAQIAASNTEVAYFTGDSEAAARGLGMSRVNLPRAIHGLKDAAGLRGDDDELVYIPTGDVYFNGENIGNLNDE